MDTPPENKKVTRPDSRKLVGNIISLGSGETIARIVAFVGTAYAARQLGPEQFGVIGFALAIFSYFSIAVSGGFNDVGSREVARRPGDASSIAANVIFVRLFISVIGLILLGITVWFINKPPTVKLVVLLTGLLFFSLAIDTSWVYKGLERTYLVSLSLIISQILYAGLIFITVYQPNDVVYVPIAQFIGEICAAFILTVPLFGIRKKINFDWREGISILRESVFWTVSRLMRAVMYSFDVVLIGLWIGVEAVGFYNAPYRICFLLVAIAVAIHTSFLPGFIRASNQDNNKTQIGKIAEQSLTIAAVVAAPLVVGGIIVAAPMLELVFGSEYANGAGAFQFLLISVGCVFLQVTNHNVFLAVNHLKTEMKIFAAAAAINIILNILIIPHYGIIGASAVTAFAEILALVIGYFVIRKLGVPINIKTLWKPLAASGVMGAILLISNISYSLILSLIVGSIIYVLALFMLGVTPKKVFPSDKFSSDL